LYVSPMTTKYLLVFIVARVGRAIVLTIIKNSAG
jgi:hypothetical protein